MEYKLEDAASSYWIVGGGRFGTMAVERLKKKSPKAAITVVDQNPQVLEPFQGQGVETVCLDGASFLATHMEHTDRADWIIPAVPIHLALGWVRFKLAGKGTVETVAVPDAVEKRLPNPIRGSQGQVYTSYADFVCPDNCREPYDRCTFTGKPRKGLLYRSIQDLALDGICSVVIRSRQLAPGVGGYRPDDLEQSLENILKCHTPLILFSTACLCHGVVEAFRLKVS